MNEQNMQRKGLQLNCVILSAYKFYREREGRGVRKDRDDVVVRFVVEI